MRGYELYDKIIKLADKGLNGKEIADLLHISASTVSYVKTAARACREEGEISTSIPDRIVDWATEKFGVTEIKRTTEIKLGEKTAEDANSTLLLEAICLNNKLLKQNIAANERIARALEHIWSKEEAEV